MWTLAHYWFRRLALPPQWTERLVEGELGWICCAKTSNSFLFFTHEDFFWLHALAFGKVVVIDSTHVRFAITIAQNRWGILENMAFPSRCFHPPSFILTLSEFSFDASPSDAFSASVRIYHFVKGSSHFCISEGVTFEDFIVIRFNDESVDLKLIWSGLLQMFRRFLLFLLHKHSSCSFHGLRQWSPILLLEEHLQFLCFLFLSCTFFFTPVWIIT